MSSAMRAFCSTKSTATLLVRLMLRTISKIERTTIGARPSEPDVAAPAHATRDGAQRRGLARAVRSEQRDHTAFRHRERHSMEHRGRPVTRMDVLELEQRGHQAAPRYASITAGLRCTSAGLPSAIFLPKSSTTTRSQMPITNAM